MIKKKNKVIMYIVLIIFLYCVSYFIPLPLHIILVFNIFIVIIEIVILGNLLIGSKLPRNTIKCNVCGTVYSKFTDCPKCFNNDRSS